MFEPVIQQWSGSAPDAREAEYVERKGLGHPDAICDAVMEAAAHDLAAAYIESCGKVLHYNLDKALLAAGETTPKLGGGRVVAPMRLIIGDRATGSWKGTKIEVGEIVEAAVRDWFRRRLRLVDAYAHLEIQDELRRGSAELAAIVELGDRPARVANDTSIAVGFAPLTETERLVLAAEHFLNSTDFKYRYPETGEDVKVTAVRRGRQLQLIVAMAFVDAYLWETATYLHRKSAIAVELESHLGSKLHQLDDVSVKLNALDDASRGAAGLFLTVLGTSAEAGDSGQVGRGNRANGLITPCRPMSLEAVCGKNPVSHVGKVYNVLAQEAAEAIVQHCDPVEGAAVWLCSQIGAPLTEPYSAAVDVQLPPDVGLEEVRPTVEAIFDRAVSDVHQLSERLVADASSLGRSSTHSSIPCASVERERRRR